MVVLFDAEQTDSGWRVVDRRTGAAARIDGMTAEGMDETDAGEIADLLNTLAFLRSGAVQH